MGKLIYKAWAGPFLYPIDFEFEVASGIVKGLGVTFGYGHRSTELRLAKSVGALPAYISYVCTQHSVGHTWAVFRALEELAEEPVPYGVQRLRTIALEVERLIHHFTLLRNLAVALRWDLAVSLGEQALDMALTAAAALGGLPLGQHFVFAGYFAGHLSTEGLAWALARVKAVADLLADLWVHHPSVGERLIGLAKIDPAQASELGLVGPLARASGISCDVRSLDPFGAYHDFAPKVEPQHAGDAYARVVVTSSEVLDAVTLAQTLANELGPEVPVPSGTLRLMPGLRASRIEGADGETVAVISVGEGPCLEAVHLRPASAANAAAIPVALQGVKFEDWTLAYLSLGICPTCVDR